MSFLRRSAPPSLAADQQAEGDAAAFPSPPANYLREIAQQIAKDGIGEFLDPYADGGVYDFVFLPDAENPEQRLYVYYHSNSRARYCVNIGWDLFGSGWCNCESCRRHHGERSIEQLRELKLLPVLAAIFAGRPFHRLNCGQVISSGWGDRDIPPRELE